MPRDWNKTHRYKQNPIYTNSSQHPSPETARTDTPKTIYHLSLPPTPPSNTEPPSSPTCPYYNNPYNAFSITYRIVWRKCRTRLGVWRARFSSSSMRLKGGGGSQCLWGSIGGCRGLLGSWSKGWRNWMRIIRGFRESLGRRMLKYRLWVMKGFKWGRPLPKSKRKKSLLKRSSWGFWSRKRRNSNNTSHRNTTSSYRKWLEITKNCYPNKERRLAPW